MERDPKQDIEVLIELLAQLPGFGPRSARRAVLMLLKKRENLMSQLAQSMAAVALKAKDCESCGNISTEGICSVCSDPQRDTGEICIVEDIADLWAIERARIFRGRYHVLGGTLSPLDAIGPDELRIPQLISKVQEGTITEVILAMNATVDGMTTAHYIADTLEGWGVRVTTLAQGVPIGGELDYLDDGTISAALRARRQL